MSEKDDMAQALRELLNNWRNRYGVYVNGRPSLTTDNCIHDIKSLLAAHDSRARPESVPDGQIAERLDILRRICTRGKNYFVETKDSMGVDLFDHMTTEVEYLAGDLSRPAQPASVADGWVMVPRVPTEAMVQAAMDCQEADPDDGDDTVFYYGFTAAVDAAPQPPVKEKE